MARTPVAVLISGRGSNLASLLEAASDPGYPAEIVLVVSNRADAGGLEHAARHGVPTQVIDHRDFADRAGFEAALARAIEAAGAEIICLAGFMRILTPGFIERWPDRIINIHPALLPAFPGLHTHEQVLAAGVRITGATVHIVRAEVDAGPILVQGAVPVLAGDDAERLAARVLAVEHRIYPLALGLVASGRVRVAGDVAVVEGPPGDGEPAGAPAPLIWPA